MSLKRWFGGFDGSVDSPAVYLTASEEQENLTEAMQAAEHIFNDDLEAAAEHLKHGSSNFHTLGQGLVAFIQATLGFEEYAIKNDALGKALNGRGFVSRIYGLGSEYALCCAVAQLMQAVLGVLTENLSDCLKGFYKLRKAYQTLDAIIQAEHRYKASQTSALWTLEANPPETGIKPSTVAQRLNISEYSSDDESFVDAEERNDNYQPLDGENGLSPSHKALYPPIDDSTSPISDLHKKDVNLEFAYRCESAIGSSTGTKGNGSIFQHPIDLFIHSGTCMCFGTLLLIISLIPPTFSRLLSVIGFRGDRERGLILLWQAAESDDINGAMAALTLLGYYNTFIIFCDILPDPVLPYGTQEEHVASYPIERLEKLLENMRKKYPKSGLWAIEEARMHAQRRRISQGLAVLEQETGQSHFKQVVALAGFEKSLQALFAHEYELCAKSFQRCCELNNWSHTLYLYVAGCAEVQLHRKFLSGKDAPKFSPHGEAAMNLFAKARGLSGKRRMFARQLPLEAFVARKQNKWDARAEENGLTILEAIGVAPCQEIVYIFGGFKKMNDVQIEQSIESLEESERLLTVCEWGSGAIDEWAASSLLKAAALRSRGNCEEAILLLRNEVLPRASEPVRDKMRDEWIGPAAHYEMAANLWAIRTPQTNSSCKENIELVRDARDHLKKAAKWRSYDIEARMGMRINMAQNAIKSWLDQNDLV